MEAVRCWDRKIRYEDLKEMLKDEFNLYLSLYYKKKRKTQISKHLFYLSIAILQLLNGLRSSEAVEAIINYIEEDKPICRVRKRKDKVYRDVIVPELIKLNRAILEKIYYTHIKNKVKDLNLAYRSWFLKNYDINTHTLRKAFESYLSRKLNKDLSLITEFQKRKSINSHLSYLRYEEAKEEIEKLILRDF